MSFYDEEDIITQTRDFLKKERYTIVYLAEYCNVKTQTMSNFLCKRNTLNSKALCKLLNFIKYKPKGQNAN